MRENNRKPIEKCIKKLPQFTTMNVIDGQAGLVIYSSLIFYSLTIDNILNIIVLLILAGVSIAMLTGDNGILNKATTAKQKTEETTAEERVKLEVGGSFDNTGKYNTDLAKENLENHLGAIVTKNEDGSLGVTYEGYDFKIDINGEVSEANYFKLSIISDTDQGEHTLGIDEQGNLWAWGRNENGELGNGTTTRSSSIPVQIKEGTKFKKVGSGHWYSLAIDEQGNLWAWGYNRNGQLGDGTTTNSSIPIQIKEGTKFKEVSAGLYHSLAIDEQGNLWAWGDNRYGQLGDGTTTNSSIPIQIKEETKFKEVSSRYYSTLAIDEQENLWAWGNNRGYGHLGNEINDNISIPTQIMVGIKVKEVAMGSASGGRPYSVVIDIEGNVWTAGSNWYGQLGRKTDEYFSGMKSSYTFQRIEIN